MEKKHKRLNMEKKRAYVFFSHRECEFFPCHRTDDPDNFNCLFCYCPLYALGENCGGAFAYTETGIKDCSACLLPHRRENYSAIVGKFGEIAKLAGRHPHGGDAE